MALEERASRLSIGAAASEAPDALALSTEAIELSFAALAERVLARADVWRSAGLDPSRGRVALEPSPSLEGVLDLLTALELEVPAILVHPAWPEPDRRRAVRAAGAHLYFGDGVLVERRGAPEPAPRWPGARPPALVVHTSGSRGAPRAVAISRRALLAAAEAHAAALPFEARDRWLLAMPLAHIGGVSILTRSIFARSAVVLAPPGRFEPRAFVARATQAKVTLVSLVPTQLHRLLEAELEPPPTLRAALLGGAATRPALLARGRAAGWPLLPTYGQTETTAQLATQRLEDPRPTGVGPPLPGLEVRVDEAGEIRARGGTLMDGYLDGAPAIDSAGWLATGDLGHLDADGHLHVVGRADDRIVTGGENVDPSRVEQALEALPGVEAACVVGLADPAWGARVAALVAGRDLAPDALLTALRATLAGYERPRTLRVVERLPLSPNGKVDRAAVVALLDG